jgi:hypothetical protein
MNKKYAKLLALGALFSLSFSISSGDPLTSGRCDMGEQTDDIDEEVTVLKGDEAEKFVNDISSCLLKRVSCEGYEILVVIMGDKDAIKSREKECLCELHDLKDTHRLAEIGMPERVRKLMIMQDRYTIVRDYLMHIMVELEKLVECLSLVDYKDMGSGYWRKVAQLGRDVQNLRRIYYPVTDKISDIIGKLAVYERRSIIETAVSYIEKNDKGSILRACFDRSNKIPPRLPLSEEIAYDGAAISPEKRKALVDAEKCVEGARRIGAWLRQNNSKK